MGLHRLDLLAGFFVHELDVNSLRYAPALLMGFRSIARAPVLRAREVELQNLRRTCHGLSTIAALKAAAVRHNAGSHQRLFRIDERTLDIEPLFDIIDPALDAALSALRLPPLAGPHNMALAQVTRPMEIKLRYAGETRHYEIASLPATLPSPTMHDAGRERQRRLVIPWSALIQEADAMDLLDANLPSGRRGNWRARLDASALQRVQADGEFLAEDGLTLEGIKHLLGLPGAGKTTLLMCLLRYLGTHGVKVAVFFPSIAVSRQYLEALRRYGVRAGLLVGQSRDTRNRHAHTLAEALATDDELRGFGKTTDTAGLFEGLCALHGLTAAPSDAFNVGDSYCQHVLQYEDNANNKRRPRPKECLCPAWSVCGFTRAARELPQASVWLGHILSADTHVPRHTSELDEHYFELIGRSFDVVIFDEADRAQQDLDQRGLAELRLTGHTESFHHQIQRNTLERIATGQNSVLVGFDYAQLSVEIAEFGKLTTTLIHAILRLSDKLRNPLNGTLMSPMRIIDNWLSLNDRRVTANEPWLDLQAAAKSALCDLWESAAIRAFQNRGARAAALPPQKSTVARIAATFAMSEDEASTRYRALCQLLSDWLAEPELKTLSDLTKAIADTLEPLRRKATDAETRQVIGLLLPVTFTILSYRRLSLHQQAMADEGLIEPVQVDTRASVALLAASPDNVLGSLSGVRFTMSKSAAPGQAGDVQLQYVVFAGAPRLLLYRLHEWEGGADGEFSGPAVLLTSATSYLPASPAYHVAVTPEYVLKRRHPERADAPASHYEFRPIPAGASADARFLRFSGASPEVERTANLEKMALALLEGGPSDSVLARDCGGFDVREGIPRRAAFIVNSYDQAGGLKRSIENRLPAWRDKVVAVVDKLPPDRPASAGYVTPGGVEALGDDERWQVLIFPAGALGRGTNLVFSTGARQRDAVLGTLYFLTRPHPAPGDMSLLVSIAARATLDFDLRPNDATTLEQLSESLNAARRQTYGRLGPLVRRSVYARALGNLFEPFTANMGVSIMQTIGRAMRNGCPVQCFFVDLAWAERSARGEPDTEHTSMLVMLRRILERGANSNDPREAALFHALFGEFLAPLSNVAGLLTASPGEVDDADSAEEPWHDNPLWNDDDPFQPEH